MHKANIGYINLCLRIRIMSSVTFPKTNVTSLIISVPNFSYFMTKIPLKLKHSWSSWESFFKLLSCVVATKLRSYINPFQGSGCLFF